MKITTNNVPRELVTFHDLPEAEREDFDYIEEDGQWSPRLFCYRGHWYDSHEFERARGNEVLTGWDGVQSDTYFSGTLIRYANDFEHVIVGRYFS